MTTLVVGASGATGRLLVQELLGRGHAVKAMVRSTSELPEALQGSENLSVIHADILGLKDTELVRHVEGCRAVASCLGHNMSLKGILGPPRRLVTEATRRLCRAIEHDTSGGPTRFVLMNTAGNRNRDLVEQISLAEKAVIGLLRLAVPPHADNECAADYLRVEIGQDHPAIQWAAVRPDSLIDEDEGTPYSAHASPTRSAIFDAGLTSRINVARFMADLMTEDEIWDRWRGRMPIIYNASPG